MHTNRSRATTFNFKAQSLTDAELRAQAPSVFSPGPMAGLSHRYAFVPTADIVQALGDRGWVPVDVEQQRVRSVPRIGFQKHLVRFRRAEQMQTLDEWNAELVLTNSHDALCAYVLRIGIFRRVCSNGLVVGDETFDAIRFRHAGLKTDEVVHASERIIEFVPRLGALIERFRNRLLADRESLGFASHALALRYGTVDAAPVEPRTLLEARRPEDQPDDLWTVYNRVGENLIRGGLADARRDRHGCLRSVRSLRGIDSRVSLNMGLWQLAERTLTERNGPRSGAPPKGVPFFFSRVRESRAGDDLLCQIISRRYRCGSRILSALANAGVPEDVRMKLTGHSSKAMNTHYTHLEVGTLRKAVTALPLFGSKPPETDGAPDP